MNPELVIFLAETMDSIELERVSRDMAAGHSDSGATMNRRYDPKEVAKVLQRARPLSQLQDQLAKDLPGRLMIWKCEKEQGALPLEALNLLKHIIVMTQGQPQSRGNKKEVSGWSTQRGRGRAMRHVQHVGACGFATPDSVLRT